VASIFGASSVLGQVVINEFVKDERTQGTGSISPDTREFVELYNAGNTTIDLSGYTIRSTDVNTGAQTNDTLPGGSSIAPNGFFVIAAEGRALDSIANYKIAGLGTSEVWPDSANLLFELLDGSSALVDAIQTDAYRAPQQAPLTAEQLAQVGTGLTGRNESYNPDASPVPNVTMSYARYRDGVDSNKNGRDFGYLPVTPGASNTLPTVAAHVVPNVDAMAVGSRLSTYNASFDAPQVIAPGTVDVSNPKAIAPSPQGGNAISAWDETGGGNVIYSQNYVNKFDLWAYIDTTDLNMNTDTWEAEWTAFGIGSTDPQFRTPNSNGLVPTGGPATVGENGSTGIGWFYERFEDTTGALDVNSFKLSIIDFGQGGNSVPAAQTPGDDKWNIIQTFELTPADSGWHRLSIDYNPATGAVEAKYDANTVNFLTVANQVGTFYAGYREGLTGESTTFADRVRPATWDMIAAAPVNDANFDNDGDVDGRDFLVWQRNTGGAGDNSLGDANGNGQVNDADFAIWKTQFGTTGLAAAAGAAVPEPATGLLLGLGALALAFARRAK
jgi:hypothetical protein